MTPAVKGVVAVMANADKSGARRHGGVPALIPVGNRSLLSHALLQLQAAGIEEVAVVAPSWLTTAIARDLRGLELHTAPSIVTRERIRGAGDALRTARGFVGHSPAVVLFAEGVVRADLAALIGQVLTGEPAAVLLAHANGGAGDQLRLDHRRLLRFAMGVSQGRQVDDVCGLVLGAGVTHEIFEERPNARDLSEMLAELPDGGRGVVVDVARSGARYAGRSSDLLRLNRLILEALPPFETASLPGVRLDGTVQIHPTAVIESSVLRGPVVVGANARIHDSYVGPFTSIGEDVRIEGAEVEHSIILPGAEILHIGSRLEASVVGRDARIYRDFSLPRAMRLQVGDSVEVALC